MNTAVVIEKHRHYPYAIKVRLWTGEELWMNEYLVGKKVQIGEVIEDVRVEYVPRVLSGRVKEKAAS
jgi:hypothetical protein